MIACDTNVLFPALEASHPSHGPARAWLESMVEVREFALCELVKGSVLDIGYSSLSFISHYDQIHFKLYAAAD